MNGRILLAVLLLLAGFGGGIWNWQQRQEIAALQTRVDALVRQRAARPPPALATPPAEAAPALGASPAPNPPLPAATGAAALAPAVVEVSEPGADPRKAEELRKLDALETQATLDRSYASVYLALENLAGVTPAQIAQLKALLAQKREIGMTALTQRDFTAVPDQQEWERSLTAAEDALDEQIKQTIGDRGFSLYQEEKKILPQRKTTELVAQSLAASSEALSTSQRDQLAAVLAKYPTAGEDQSHTALTSLFNFAVTPSAITNEAMKAAASFLSPGQLQALQQVHTQQKTQEQLFDWLDRIQQPAKASPEAAPAP